MNKETRIKNIMEYHLHWNDAVENAIKGIMFEIAEGEEKDLLIELGYCSENLRKRAEKIYNKYKGN